jgi:hypothetical protein
VGTGSTYVLTNAAYSSDGTELWSVFGAVGEVGAEIALDPTGNLLVGCWSGLVVSLDSAGEERWTYDFGGPDNARPQDMAFDGTGRAYLAGYVYLEPGNQDYLTVALDPNGNELWSASYEGPAQGDDAASALALGPAGEVLVTGSADAGPSRNLDYATIRYLPAPSGVSDRSGPDLVARVVPHPVRDQAWITLRLPLPGAGRLAIVDATGRKQASLELTDGRPVLWNARGLASGTYWGILEGAPTSGAIRLVVVR